MRKGTILCFMVLATILFFVVIGFGVHSSSNVNTKELKLLHVIVRHGARTPVDTFPNDPYINESFYPVGWGQLTNSGKLQLYNLGKYLRNRYDTFLGTLYYPDEYYAQSTAVDRAIASAQTINAGLWPPDSAQAWGPLPWQPIPVHFEPLSEDNLLLVRRPCAQYHLELARVYQTQQVQKKFKEFQVLFDELSTLTGNNITNFDDVLDVYSTLRAEEAMNLTIHAPLSDYYPDKMTQPTVFSFELNAYTDKLKRLKGGVLLKKLLSDWRSKLEGRLANKMFLYCGHDSTIVNVLSALNVWDAQIPEYGTMILLEFSIDRITNVPGLEVYLRNFSDTFLLTIPGCESFCPLEKFVELTQKVIPGDWDEECRTNNRNYEPPPPKNP